MFACKLKITFKINFSLANEKSQAFSFFHGTVENSFHVQPFLELGSRVKHFWNAIMKRSCEISTAIIKILVSEKVEFIQEQMLADRETA